jgi:group I intron endonuclease
MYKKGRDEFIDYIAKSPAKRNRGDKDKEGIIYALICMVNKKLYVGQTNNFGARMDRHFSRSAKKSRINSAIEKYGRKNFISVILLADIVNQQELNLTEIALIKALDCLAPNYRGYNIRSGGNGGPHAKETRERISVGLKKTLSCPITRAAIGAKISASKKGKARSTETRAAISSGLKKTLSCPIARAAIGSKISASRKGKARSAETRAAISSGLKKTLANKKPVKITLLSTRLEIQCTSLANAGKEMGVSLSTISDLANNKTKKSKSKGGDYAGQFFTARFRDE